jgi:hypothetical protein
MTRRAAIFRLLLRGLACAAFALAGPSLFSLDSAEAWKRAVAMNSAAKTLYPGSVDFTTIEYGNKDQVLSREEVLSRIEYGPDGETSSEVVKAVKDGKDVTAERRAEFEKNAKKNKGKKGGNEGPQAGGFALPEPFNPPAHAKLSVGAASPATEEGKDFWEYPFEYSAKGGMSFKGTVRLEADSGRPIWMKYSFKVSPPGIKYAHFLIAYAAFGESAFVADRMDIGFDADLLVFKKKMDMKVAMTDYRERGRSYGD